MHTPATDYVAFWQTMALGGIAVAAGIVLALAALSWLICGMIVIGGLRKPTLRRVLFALAIGPLLLRNRDYTN